MLSRTLSFCFSQGLHPYLTKQLEKLSLLPLRQAQLKTIELSKAVDNIFINEVDGSGKTLAYLLPVLNELLHLKREDRVKHKGAIIVTLSKQLALQIYTQIRMLDPENKVNVKRCGSITHYSPVVEEMCKPAQNQDLDMISEAMDKNIAESVIWPETDILITTPKILYRILQQKVSEKKALTPKYLILDEADLLLSSKDLLTYTHKNISFLQHFLGKSMILKYFLAGPTQSFLQGLQSKTPKLPKAEQFFYTGYSAEQNILASLKARYIRLQAYDKEEVLFRKLEVLLKLITHPEKRRILIFCSRENIEHIKNAIVVKTDLKPTEIFANMSTEKRTFTLFNFIEGTSDILLATDLISRGINLGKAVDAIISFDIEDPQTEIARMCRSNKQEGEYFMIVEQSKREKLKDLFEYEGEVRKYFKNNPTELRWEGTGQKSQ